jgi:predicted alpha-1,2-mannosidase
MNKKMIILQLLLSMILSSAIAKFYAQNNLIKYVNPFIGTGGHGHTYPGASLPHGMVQLSPDTDIDGWDWCSGYHYSDSSIIGFSHTHLSGTGCADYGDILFMPTNGEIKLNHGAKANPDEGYRSRFSHKNEKASAGYYSVFLDDYKIKVELTATERCGFQRYTSNEDKDINIIIDLVHGIQDKTTDSEINIIDNNIVEGYRRSTGWAKDHTVYFHAEFSQPFQKSNIAVDGNFTSKTEEQGEKLKAILYFNKTDKPILVKVGISHTSLNGAIENLKSEIPNWDFDSIKKSAEDKWEEALSLINVESKADSIKTIFYSALYHSLLNPNLESDVNGTYVGMDHKIHNTDHDVYTVFSLWDTFRAEHPLFTLINKDKDADMIKSLLQKYQESGLLPVWELASNETGTMIGYHSIPVIVDAYFKGIRNFDVELAFEAMKKSAMQDNLGLEYYKEMGYIPADLENESVSKTLEYAYDDWCIAMMAKDLGKTEDYNYFIDRAKFYTNVFDPTSSLMRAKKNGKWYEPFDPFSVSGNYTEANAWQYSFFVPQDISGLMNLMGGREKFISKLDELFTTNPQLTGRFQSDITGLIGQYAHGNEPSHHMAYLYNYASEPWKTQDRVHEILTTMYSTKIDGLSGNEDCGQMSAWYVLSSMGFYPVCPGDEKYIIGTPLFDHTAINTGTKEKFEIIAKNLSPENHYIKSANLNGNEYPFAYITQTLINNGGKLFLEMTSTPSKWGSNESDLPVSKIDKPFLAVPYLTSGNRIFKDTTTVMLNSTDPVADIYYTLDGSNPETNKNKYVHPILLNRSASLKAVVFKDGIFSKVAVSNFNKIPEGRSVKLFTEYSPAHTGGGPLGLIDSIKGSSNFNTDAWQGYEGNDLLAVVDLGKVQKISSVSTSFLQNVGSWIFYPKKVEYLISSDNKNFTNIYNENITTTKENSDNGIKNIKADMENDHARYVKVIAKNFGVCPTWHVASGGKAWLFIDEITIK